MVGEKNDIGRERNSVIDQVGLSHPARFIGHPNSVRAVKAARIDCTQLIRGRVCLPMKPTGKLDGTQAAQVPTLLLEMNRGQNDSHRSSPPR